MQMLSYGTTFNLISYIVSSTRLKNDVLMYIDFHSKKCECAMSFLKCRIVTKVHKVLGFYELKCLDKGTIGVICPRIKPTKLRIFSSLSCDFQTIQPIL